MSRKGIVFDTALSFLFEPMKDLDEEKEAIQIYIPYAAPCNGDTFDAINKCGSGRNGKISV